MLGADGSGSSAAPDVEALSYTAFLDEADSKESFCAFVAAALRCFCQVPCGWARFACRVAPGYMLPCCTLCCSNDGGSRLAAVERMMKLLGSHVPNNLLALQGVTDLSMYIPFMRSGYLTLGEFPGVFAKDAPDGAEWLWPRARGDPAEALALCGGIPKQQRRVVMYVHGGAFVLCNPSTHRSMTTGLAHHTDAHVLSSTYRRAPEHPFPAALEDVVRTYRSLLALAPPSRIIVAGESAGGNLVMVLTLELRRRGLPLPGGLMLVSPWLDLVDLAGPEAEKGKDYIPAHLAQAFAAAYVPDPGQRGDERVSPLRAVDVAGTPPTLLIYGGAEHLAAQGRRLGTRLRGAEVLVDEYEGPDMVHGFPIFADCTHGRFGRLFVACMTVLAGNIILSLIVCVLPPDFQHFYAPGLTLYLPASVAVASVLFAVLALGRYVLSRRAAQAAESCPKAPPMEAFSRIAAFADRVWSDDLGVGAPLQEGCHPESKRAQ